MSLRKIFRMGYEPCKGDCYCYDDVLPIDELDSTRKAAVVQKLLDMHAPMCGNEALRYGVDLVETFLGTDMLGVVDQIADSALAHFASEQFAKEAALAPGLGRGVCAYGNDASLVDFIQKTARPLHTH